MLGASTQAHITSIIKNRVEEALQIQESTTSQEVPEDDLDFIGLTVSAD